MTLTLITATYNSAATIGDCLDSVAGQTIGDVEHLIQDGASSDGTLELVQAYGETREHVRVISEPDDGIYDALNKGIASATGDVIGFLHSDDLLAGPETLSGILGYFKDPKIDGVYGDLVYVDTKNPQRVRRYWKSRDFKPGLAERGWMPAHPTLFLRRSVYEKHGSFDCTFSIAADYDFMLRVMKDPLSRLAYHPEVVVRMRLGGASNKSFRNILKKSGEDLRAMRKNQIRFPYLTLFLKNASKIPQFFRSPGTL